MLLDITKGAYVLHVGYRYREVLNKINGRYNAYTGCWEIPASNNVLGYLKSCFPEIQLPVDLQQPVISPVDLQQATDAEIIFGEGIDPYQRVGVKFLATAKRAILADHMGLGKSCQAIRAVYEVGANKVIVVTRKSLISNFKNQIQIWSPNSGKTIDWHVTNYEQVVRRLDQLNKENFDVVIADEAAYVRNRRTKRTKALNKLARGCQYVWLLTGRPVLNAPDELWSLLHIVDPKRFSSYWRFVNEYCETEHNPWSGWKRIVGVKQGVEKQLAYELSGVLLRRTNDLVGLPPITRETVIVDLLSQQQSIYDQMKKDFLVMLEDALDYVYAPTVLAQLTRLRQITCTPALIGGPDMSAKTEAILDLVDTYSQHHKIIVFTCFSSYAKLLAELLNAAIITGDMSLKDRTESEHRFVNDADCRVLVGTIGACGEGHNFQVASIVIFADKDWTPANNEQAEARAHRRGQTKPVHTISVVAKGTVDEHIEEVLKSKEAVLQTVDVITQVIEKMCPKT